MQISEIRNKVAPALQATDSDWFQAGKFKRANARHRRDAAARRMTRSSAGLQYGMKILLFTVAQASRAILAGLYAAKGQVQDRLQFVQFAPRPPVHLIAERTRCRRLNSA
jgi:hypothetical protein